ncbi:MAG: ATP-binding protein [Pseudomonadota bacterium]
MGKTYLAVSPGVRTVQLGFFAQYYRFNELMTALKGDADMPPALLWRRKYMSTALLIIDELGFEGMSREQASFATALEPVSRSRLTLSPHHLPLRPRRDPEHHQQKRAGPDGAPRR